MIMPLLGVYAEISGVLWLGLALQKKEKERKKGKRQKITTCNPDRLLVITDSFKYLSGFVKNFLSEASFVKIRRHSHRLSLITLSVSYVVLLKISSDYRASNADSTCAPHTDEP